MGTFRFSNALVFATISSTKRSLKIVCTWWRGGIRRWHKWLVFETHNGWNNLLTWVRETNLESTPQRVTFEVSMFRTFGLGFEAPTPSGQTFLKSYFGNHSYFDFSSRILWYSSVGCSRISAEFLAPHKARSTIKQTFKLRMTTRNSLKISKNNKKFAIKVSNPSYIKYACSKKRENQTATTCLRFRVPCSAKTKGKLMKPAFLR